MPLFHWSYYVILYYIVFLFYNLRHFVKEAFDWLDFLRCVFSPPLNLTCHLFDQTTAEKLRDSTGRFIVSNSNFAFIFFALVSTFANCAVTPISLVMTSCGKIPSFPSHFIIQWILCFFFFWPVNNTEVCRHTENHHQSQRLISRLHRSQVKNY